MIKSAAALTAFLVPLIALANPVAIDPFGNIKPRAGWVDISSGYVYRVDEQGKGTHAFSADVSAEYRMIFGPSDYDHNWGFSLSPKFEGHIEVGSDPKDQMPTVERLKISIRPFSLWEMRWFLYGEKSALFDGKVSQIGNLTLQLDQKALAAGKLSADVALIEDRVTALIARRTELRAGLRVDRAKHAQELADIESKLLEEDKKLEQLKPALAAAKDEVDWIRQSLDKVNAELETLRKDYSATIAGKLLEPGYLHIQDRATGVMTDVATLGFKLEFHKTFNLKGELIFDLCGELIVDQALFTRIVTEDKSGKRAAKEYTTAGTWNPSARLCMGIGKPSVGYARIDARTQIRTWKTYNDDADASYAADTQVEVSYDQIGGSPVGIYTRYSNDTFDANPDLSVTPDDGPPIYDDRRSVNTFTGGVNVRF